MKKNLLPIINSILIVSTITLSCSKSALLDEKPKTNLVVPSTIADFQAMLELDGNGGQSGTFNISPCLGDLASDNYYVLDAKYATIGNIRDKNTYTWAPDIFAGQGNQLDWNLPYTQIFLSNIALDGMNKIIRTAANQQSWNNTYGDALFIRAFAYWNLAQVFCLPYDSATAKNDLGLPLKLDPDINNVVQRSTVQQTYDRIIQDLQAAVPLAPIIFSTHLNRASKPSIYALLSRVYLSMRNYNKALVYADSSLQLYSTLIDYNTVSTTNPQPFTITNAETMYQCQINNCIYSYGSTSLVDSLLYKSYSADDLRGAIFFRTTADGPGFKYGYEGLSSNLPFSGLASSEMYLIRSECNARLGNIGNAMADLNGLLIKRWKAGTYVPYTATTTSDALNKVLTERRKELVFRSLRWMDLRRLNKEGANIIVRRVINGQIYTLAPNSNLYVFPIPDDEIAISKLKQNPR